MRDRKSKNRLPYSLDAFAAGFLMAIPIGYLLPPAPAAPVSVPDDTAGISAPYQEHERDPVTSSETDSHSEFTFDNVLIRLNEARLAAGLPQLATDSYLSGKAQEDLRGNCPVKNHNSLREKYDRGEFRGYRLVAEDLTSGAGGPQEAINDLLRSPTHADAMVGESWGWRVVGIGILTEPTNCVSLIIGK
jgi:uncharacterized protein YkwD